MLHVPPPRPGAPTSRSGGPQPHHKGLLTVFVYIEPIAQRVADDTALTHNLGSSQYVRALRDSGSESLLRRV